MALSSFTISGRYVHQALEPGKAAAGIVHGHPHAPFVDQLDGVAELVIRVELALLGDLDDDLLGRQLGQDLEQGGPVQQARGGVDGEVEAGGPLHLDAEAGHSQAGRVQFQLHTEADFVSLPENVLSTGRAFTEVRESLIAGHVPAVQVNHRLVDRCRRSRQQQAGQALVAGLGGGARGPFGLSELSHLGHQVLRQAL